MEPAHTSSQQNAVMLEALSSKVRRLRWLIALLIVLGMAAPWVVFWLKHVS